MIFNHMNGDAGDNNGDRGRDDVLPSINDELEHEWMSIEKATVTPSSSDNCVRSNDTSVSATFSGFIGQEQKCKIVNCLCCNGCYFSTVGAEQED